MSKQIHLSYISVAHDEINARLAQLTSQYSGLRLINRTSAVLKSHVNLTLDFTVEAEYTLFMLTLDPMFIYYKKTIGDSSERDADPYLSVRYFFEADLALR